ncbi:hypothetical protein BSKO_06712 [Bryopsis sp. KO-2023]|nr:hypothetical protein BSKO_06712 [Bryopsis sp. KO-2023]
MNGRLSKVSPRLPVAPPRFGATVPSHRFVRQTRSRPVVASALVVPPEYGYVVATVGFGVAVCQWMMFGVVKARVAIGLKYPAMFAEGDSEEEKKYNCTQRAHQNTLENAPMFTVMIAVLGLVRPIVASTLGTVYFLARIVYFLGYSSGDIQKRTPGSLLSFFTLIGTMAFSIFTGIQVAGSIAPVAV